MATYLRLFPPVKQFELKNGQLNVDGRLYVYLEGTDDLADIYDENGTQLQQPAITDANGRVLGLFVDATRTYRLKVCDRNDNPLFTVRKMVPSGGGGGSTLAGKYELVSTDQTVAIAKSVDAGVTTYDLGISDTLLSGTRSAEAWKGTGAFSTGAHGYLGYTAAETAVSGSGIYTEDGHVFLGRSGIYHVDAQINYAFTASPSASYSDLRFFGNGNVMGVDHFDISYNHSAGYHLGFDVWASSVPTEVGIGIGLENDGFSAELRELQVHRVAQQFGQAGGNGICYHDESLTGSGTPAYPLGIEPGILDAISGKQDASGMTSYVTNSAFSSYSSVVNSSITAIESSITSISSTVSGLTGTYIEQSASGMFQPSGNYVSADEMSSYVPFSGLEGDASGRITAISGSAVKGHEYTGIYPVNVDNTADRISVDHTGLSIDSDTMSSTLAGDQVVIGVKPGLFLEQSAFATASGQFLTAVPAGYATEGYVDSAVSGKLDVTAISQFLTALPADLAYTSDVASAVSGKLDASASSDFYPMTGNPSGFLTASYNPSFDYNTANQITAIDGSALGGMDEGAVSAIASAYAESVASAKMDASESSAFYPATSNPSGYLTAQAQASWTESASASPSYIQDKPDLVDIVAGPGIVIDNPDGNTLRVSVSQAIETVLWEGDTQPIRTTPITINLSETVMNFEMIRFEGLNSYAGITDALKYANTTPANSEMCFGNNLTISKGTVIVEAAYATVSGSSLTLIGAGRGQSNASGQMSFRTDRGPTLYKVVGINRTASAQ